ncbi:arylamine N-acetyltransferase family protein [Stackebrandtia nassauensis]|uniref:N-acetyltransferase n=1 Tax=Stackebrandtia nassauensis (strain DSM 44728 / CIP 108903 / NRRL B-16338 / NBRC 102104 / LLR-40K-21) TaxID=446470 RepID=D3Q0E9_STANL|nr:arylamine N-acetyltransferase [Stackebrandtia nassauensis]ADD39813.1 N-acetyltransferase [Stackebrandtia nassauensis DSM 44728]
MWNSEQLDLDAYLTRVGHDGDRTPTLATLRALQRAHVLNLRWDTIDSFLYREVRLDLAAIQDKLLRRGRGGYCYEHTVLFAAVLEKLGFRFTAVSARVQLGADSTTPRPATHAMLIVDLDGKRWLSDVGFGSSPLEPIELVDGGRGDSGPWPYLLRWQDITHGSPGWAVHQRGDGPEGPEGWTVRQVFTETPQYPIDYVLGNHFVASNDRSPFVTRPYIQRLRTDRYDTLDALTWTTERPGQDAVSETVRPHEVPKLLDDVFDIRVDAAEARLLVDRLTEREA